MVPATPGTRQGKATARKGRWKNDPPAWMQLKFVKQVKKANVSELGMVRFVSHGVKYEELVWVLANRG
jgi:hypothetical protein